MRPGTGLAKVVSPLGNTKTRTGSDTDAAAAGGAATATGAAGLFMALGAFGAVVVVCAQTGAATRPRTSAVFTVRRMEKNNISVNIQPGFDVAKIGIERSHQAGFVHRGA